MLCWTLTQFKKDRMRGEQICHRIEVVEIPEQTRNSRTQLFRQVKTGGEASNGTKLWEKERKVKVVIDEHERIFFLNEKDAID